MADLKLKFKMPDEETLAKYIPIKGEKGDPGDPTKTSQLENDSDFTTNAALESGLATKADKTTVQSLSSQVDSNTTALQTLRSQKIALSGGSSTSLYYYPLATFPDVSTKSASSSINIHGRIGGTGIGSSEHIDVTLVASAGTIKAFGNYLTNNTQQDRRIDFVAYKDQSDVVTLYIKAYHVFHLDIELSFYDCTNIFNKNTYSTSTPSGTIYWEFSNDDNVQISYDGVISADIDGNAQTVNGHTVDSDVPYGAAFTDTIYDDTELRDELEAKADSSDVATTYATKTSVNSSIDELETEIGSIRAAIGSPLVAATISEMTDQTKIYVYVGSETGMTSGDWYYYNGATWTDGGVYNSIAVETDKTLLIENASADALKTGMLKIAQDYPMRTIVDQIVRGWYNSGTGQMTQSTTRLITERTVSFSQPVIIIPQSGYQVGGFDIDNGVTVSWNTIQMTLYPNVTYKVGFRRDDGGDMPQNEIVNFSIKYGGSFANFYPYDSSYTFSLASITAVGIYFIQSGYLGKITDLPSDWGGGSVVLQNESYFAGGKNYIIQTLQTGTANISRWQRYVNSNTGVPYGNWVRLDSFSSTAINKKISIFGDSISTYKGYIPEGNATYYNGSNAGVTNVNQTWWYKTIRALGLDLLVNNSWSGRAVSSIRDNQEAHATDAGYKEANVLQLASDGVNPDIIIVKLGINDFNSRAPLGDYDGSTALPTNPTYFTNAYAMMLNLILTNFPLAKVYCCTLMACERSGSTGFPEINGNGDSLSAWNEAIVKLANAFGCEVLDHNACGITYYNLSTYMGDYSSSTGQGLHPNQYGHSLIANKTIEQIDNAVRTRYSAS